MTSRSTNASSSRVRSFENNPGPGFFQYINSLLVLEGRTRLTYLDPERAVPNSTWFKLENKITKSINCMFKRTITDAWPKYDNIAMDVRASWFRTFASEFNWAPEITPEVYQQFVDQCRVSYRHKINEWKQKWVLGQGMPTDIDENVWVKFVAYWGQETTKATSKRNSTNQMSDHGGKGSATHNGGPVTIEQQYEDMLEDRDGEIPDFGEFLGRRHTSKKTGQIQDPVAAEVLENYENEKVKILTQQSQCGSTDVQPLTREEKNTILLKDVPQSKGHTFSFGSLAESSSSSYQSPHLLQEVERLNKALQEEQEAREQEKKYMEDKLKWMRKENRKTKKSLRKMLLIMKAHFPEMDFDDDSDSDE